MKNYLFEIMTVGSELEGEQFLVGANNIKEAIKIAKENFPNERLFIHNGSLSDFEAELSGLDEY